MRWNYREVVTSLFIKAFAKQIGNWCQRNNLKLTGHIQGEDYLAVQTVYAGSAMRFYEHMQLPGVDLLTEYRNSFVAVKQCVSAARQFDKKQRLTELYACTGWDFPFIGHKALGDWQYALGINFRCHHLAFYTLLGEAKRDYPASIFYQSPWYNAYKKIEDYFARLGSLLTEDNEIRDLLIIHPIESMWSMCNCRNLVDNNTRFEYDKGFLHLSQELISLHIDYDYGDEEQLSRIGYVENKKLKVNCAAYDVVLIPELKTIRKSTLKLLEEFANYGGEVYYIGDIPQYQDAIPNKDVSLVYKKFVQVNKCNLEEKLTLAQRVSLTSPNGSQVKELIYRLASNDNGYTLFISNFGKEFSEDIFAEKTILERTATFPIVHINVHIPYVGNVYQFDAFTGNIYQVNFEYDNGKYIFQESFDLLESKLFVFSQTVPENVLIKRDNKNIKKIEFYQANDFEYSLSEANVLVLDHARCMVEGEFINENYILDIDDVLRKKLGVPCRGVAMLQPWLDQKEPEKFLNINLKFEFECVSIPDKECYLAIENPEEFDVYVNGICLSNSNVDKTWWIDHDIHLLKIPNIYLHLGKNEIVKSGKYHTRMSGLEALFIIGEFGVSNDKITSLPAKLICEDWTTQNLPYFSGNVVYKKVLTNIPKGKVFLSIPKWKGVALGIKINGSNEELFISNPTELDISSLVKRAGKDTIEIIVYGHRRNMFGPFYLNKTPVWVGPRQFRIKENNQKQIVECGLLAPVSCYITE